MARDPRDLQDAIELVEHFGAKIVSLLGDIDLMTPEGRLRAQMMVWHASASSEDTSRRAADTHRRSASSGRTVGGPRPFGWHEDRRSLHPVESPHLRRWIDMALRGDSWREILDDGFARGVRGTKGARMTKASIRQVVLSPRNCGFRMFRGDYVRDAAGAPIVCDWEAVCTPEEYAELVRTRGTHPRMRSREGRAPERRHHYLLIGLLRCSRCGAALRLVPRHRVRKDGSVVVLDSYACPSPTMGGCAGVARNASKVDAAVLGMIRARTDADVARTLAARAAATAVIIDQEILEVESRKSELLHGIATGRFPTSYLDVMLPVVEEQLVELRARYATESTARSHASRIRPDQFVAARWVALNLEQQRRALQDVVDKVTIHPCRKPYSEFDEKAIEVVLVGDGWLRSHTGLPCGVPLVTPGEPVPRQR